MDPPQSVLVLKTRPPVFPVGLVRRPGLAAALTAGTRRGLTVVSAGPGSGKTATVAGWVRDGDAGAPVGWLSLDDTDNDLRTFWRDLLYAVIASGGVPQNSPLRDVVPASEFGAGEALFARELLAELPGPIVVVLDDFQLIVSDEVLESFDGLIGRQSSALRLVVLSRADPQLQLHRLRIKGALTEIRGADLAFTEPEIAELFSLSGIGLRPNQVRVLRDRTEGWAAGVRLAVLSVDRDDLDGGIERFTGNSRSVADYLIGEVLARLSPPDRQFLLETSVVDRISGELADHLTGRRAGQAVLERLLAANVFVVAWGDGQEWFSYHQLLRELLRHRLMLEQPDTALDLHRRAAQWLISRRQPVDGIRQQILAGDVQGAGRTLLLVGSMILSGEGPLLAAAIEPLAKMASSDPSFGALLASATWHLHRREFAAMHRDAALAGEYLPDLEPGLRPSAELVLALLAMMGARATGDSADVVALAARAAQIVQDTPARGLLGARQYGVIARINLAGGRLWTGPHDGLDAQLDNAAAEALEMSLLLPHLNATGHLALLLAIRGRYREAARHASLARQITERRGWQSEAQSLAGYLAGALVELGRHHPGRAAGQVTAGLVSSGGDKQTDRAIRLGLGIAAVQAAVAGGDVAAALAADARIVQGLARTPAAAPLLTRWSAAAGGEALLLAGRPLDAAARMGTPAADLDYGSSWQRVVLARVRIALGELPSAEQLIVPLLSPGYPFREHAVAAHLLHAVIADRRRRDLTALTALTAAIDLAEPDGIRRPFVQIGGPLSPMLTNYQQMGGRHDRFTADIVDLLAPHPVTESGSLMVDTLTDRESVVLRYLPTMLKAGEIAALLFVSVNTVKAHLRSMYRKLGVSSRREAVERARSLGLL